MRESRTKNLIRKQQVEAVKKYCEHVKSEELPNVMKGDPKAEALLSTRKKVISDIELIFAKLEND